MIEFHLIFLSNKYQDLKAELTHIDRIRKKRKLKTKDETEAKELKNSWNFLLDFFFSFILPSTKFIIQDAANRKLWAFPLH